MHQNPSPPGTTLPRPEDATTEKVRIRFRKDGDLRLVSHHDLMHVFERMLRRADIPFCYTQGFHPKPRLVFALSLALGIVGCEEVADLDVTNSLEPEELFRRLSEQSPPGLTILRVDRVNMRSKSQVNRVCYRLAVTPDRLAPLSEHVQSFLSSSECWVERSRPQPRRIDVRPFVRGIRLLSDAVELDLWVGPHGAARPEEILAQIGLADLLDQGAVLSRTKLELLEEKEQAEVRPAFLLQPAGAGRGKVAASPPPEPLLPGPFSFDS